MILQKRLPILIALTLVLALGASARTSPITRADAAAKVDDFVKSEMSKQSIPGLTIAVVKEGKIIKAAGYGLANVELDVTAKTDTVYKIGSVSKQFLASGIMLLAEDGKLSLDDKISKYLDGTPATWSDITIRHCLTHTSGILREGPAFAPYKVQPEADVIKSAYPEPMRFKPGEKWEYCNVGYFILAQIITKQSGKYWGDFLNERIFAPLDMKSTRVTTLTDLVMNRAGSYYVKDGKFLNADELTAVRPSGAFISTVLDLAKYDAALYTERPLSAKSKKQMWTPVTLNSGATHPYGFGWELITRDGHTVVHHGGSLSGFRAEFARYIDDRLSIIVLTNGANATPNSIAKGIADIYLTTSN